ncbi:hypothetical protein CF065_04575 [Clostridium sporogenes]
MNKLSFIKYKEMVLDKIFLIDKLYNNEDYNRLESNVEKYLYYRFQISDGIDVDSSILMMPIYLIMNLEILGNEIKCEKQSGCSKKYELFSSKYEKYYFRGDTAINCMSVIQQLFSCMLGNTIHKPTKSNINDKDYKNMLNECISQMKDEEYTDIRDLLEEHIRLCYSISNFYLIPYYYKRHSLNVCKNGFKSGAFYGMFDDDMYLFLLTIRCYILGEETYDKHSKIYADMLNKYYKEWIDSFGEGIKGWKNFIRINCFESFMDINSEKVMPIHFWNVRQDNINFKSQIRHYLLKINLAMNKRENKILEKCKDIDSEKYGVIF